MTLYAEPPGLQRWINAIRGLQGRVTRLEKRTAALDSGFPVACLPGQVDPGYVSGDPMVYVNGATTLTGPYQHLASYTPVASESVLLAPVGVLTTYVVLGKLA